MIQTMHPEEFDIAWRPEIIGWSTGILSFYNRIARELPQGAKVVELGSYVCRSAGFLAERTHQLGKGTAILAVDPGEYYAGSWLRMKRNAAILSHEAGVPCWSHDVTPWQRGEWSPGLHLVRARGADIAPLVEDRSIFMPFIDADHRYEAVRDDIDTWLPKVQPGGIIAGHDYGHPDLVGVKRAVDEMFVGREVHIEPATVWWVRC